MPQEATARVARLPAAGVLAVAFLAVAGHGACATRHAPAAPGASVTAAPKDPAGALFSTLPCDGSPLGRTWTGLRDEAEARFPGLRLTKVEDLHLTVVYVGEGWKPEDLEAIRARALPKPRETVSFRPEVVRMGWSGQVIAVEMHGAPDSWVADVIAAKGELTRLGLKKPDRYDTTFRPHVTLASARRSPPDAAEAAALDELRAWLAAKAAVDEGAFAITAGPDVPVRLWLAGTPRPPGSPEYVDLEGVLPRH